MSVATLTRPLVTRSALNAQKALAPKKASLSKEVSEPSSASTKDNLKQVREGKSLLQRGAKGEAVKDVQALLNKATGSKIDADGDFGSKTRKAVLGFQKAQGLGLDGKVGKNTLAALEKSAQAQDAKIQKEGRQGAAVADAQARAAIEDNAMAENMIPAKKGIAQGAEQASADENQPAYVGEVLRQGAHSSDVSLVQERLNTLGYDAGTPDGEFGKNTAAAVKRFQSDNALDADGVVGKNTYEALNIEAPPSASGAKAGSLSAAFRANPIAVAAGAKTFLGKEIAKRAPRYAQDYKTASEKTGVPASIIAAIHGQESGFGTHAESIKGPESGFGLDPRYVSTNYGNKQLAKHGLGKWQRGKNTATNRLQSAVVAAEHFKRGAKAAGVHVGPNMNERDILLSVTAYAAGAGSKISKRARATGKSFLFNPADNTPHPFHPGGTSIGRGGRTIRVKPGYKKGLLRWDVMLPLIDKSIR